MCLNQELDMNEKKINNVKWNWHILRISPDENQTIILHKETRLIVW